MSKNSVRIKVPASVANVSCGFDCIGYSVEEPADFLTITKSEQAGIEIIMSGSGADTISTLSWKNTAGKGIMSLLTAVDEQQGFSVHIEKGIAPGSGLGSSAASAVGGVIGANLLLGSPLTPDELLIHCMAGEAVASGGFHADNVAPALLGGIQLIRSYDPLDIISLPVPENLFSTVVLPDLTINTKEARAIVPKHVPIKSAVEQAGSLAGFTSGFIHRRLRFYWDDLWWIFWRNPIAMNSFRVIIWSDRLHWMREPLAVEFRDLDRPYLLCPILCQRLK